MESDEILAFAKAIAKLKQTPSLIHHPEVSLFKDLLTSLGVQLPEAGAAVDVVDLSDGETPVRKEELCPAESVHVADSDDDDPGRLPEESEPFPTTARPTSAEPTDAQQETCSQCKAAGQEALDEGNIAKAIEHYTEAILTEVASALVYAKRGELLLKERRPRAAISDCSVAIEVNPDCGKAYRIRGLACRRLGLWEQAQKDLMLGQKLDYDEDVQEIQKFVCDKVRKQEAKSTGTGGLPRKRRRLTA
mmetsp:Transcript_31801/g.62530  ORF Transcript_31801/g.62530 Transcript_31801/m.62530 type:complete len:248 (+) Transcript_31801:69-812(+)